MNDFHQGKQLAVGIYDWNGEIHIDEREAIIGLGGNPDDPAARERMQEAVENVARDMGLEIVIRDA